MSSQKYFIAATNSVAATAVAWSGGLGLFYAQASTWDSSTAALQVSFDGGTTYVTVNTDGTACSFTSNASPIKFTLPHGVLIKCVISGGSPTALNAWATSAALQGTVL